MRVYIDLRDWWVGVYVGKTYVYICLVPCVVVRLARPTLGRTLAAWHAERDAERGETWRQK